MNWCGFNPIDVFFGVYAGVDPRNSGTVWKKEPSAKSQCVPTRGLESASSRISFPLAIYHQDATLVPGDTSFAVDLAFNLSKCLASECCSIAPNLHAA